MNSNESTTLDNVLHNVYYDTDLLAWKVKWWQKRTTQRRTTPRFRDKGVIVKGMTTKTGLSRESVGVTGSDAGFPYERHPAFKGK